MKTKASKPTPLTEAKTYSRKVSFTEADTSFNFGANAGGKKKSKPGKRKDGSFFIAVYN